MPGDYIERAAVLDYLAKCADGYPYIESPTDAILDAVNAIPAADVVEVIRCRECIFWDASWNPGVGMKGEAHYCPRCQLVTLKDSFCSGAYRKDGGQDDV